MKSCFVKLGVARGWFLPTSSQSLGFCAVTFTFQNMKHLFTFFILAFCLNSFAFAQTSKSQLPQVVSGVAPIFPATVAAIGWSGDAVVEVEVRQDGEVSDVRFVSGHPLVRKFSEEAAKRWRFASVATKGKRLAQLTFSFRLMPLKTRPEELVSIFMPPYHIEVRREQYEPIIHSDPESYTIPKRGEKSKK